MSGTALNLAYRLRQERRTMRERAGDEVDLLSSPPWDIMLDLYVRYGEPVPVTAIEACDAAAIAPTTALRWLMVLQQRGLVDWGEIGSRSRTVSLSSTGLAFVERVLSERDR